MLKRLDIEKYETKTPYTAEKPVVNQVKIYTKQHVGAPSVVVKDLYSTVLKGELLAKNEDGKLGANIHASIDGVIKEITSNYVIISKE